MILASAVIGLTVGLLLGITGAGGAVVAVPLFMSLAGASLREATVLSLSAVGVAALFNWWVQRRETEYRIAIPMFLTSIVGSALIRPVKAHAPEAVIAVSFLAVTLLSLQSVWRKPGASEEASAKKGSELLKALLGGVGLGVLVTLTGLGGGVILVPLLRRLFGLPFGRTAPTSLGLILFTSLTSLALQHDEVRAQFSLGAFAALAVGSVLAAMLAGRVARRVPPVRLDLARKWLLTAVIGFSALSVGLRLIGISAGP